MNSELGAKSPDGPSNKGARRLRRIEARMQFIHFTMARERLGTFSSFCILFHRSQVGKADVDVQHYLQGQRLGISGPLAPSSVLGRLDIDLLGAIVKRSASASEADWPMVRA